MWRSTKLPFLFCSVLFSLLIVSINFSTSFSVPYSPLSCPSNQYSCGDSCIPLNRPCYRSADCKTQSDEKDCLLLSECDKSEFRCNNDKCISRKWRCDKKDDCGDLSDEINCTCDQFSCANGICIPHSWKCDGINDCEDNSDEKYC